MLHAVTFTLTIILTIINGFDLRLLSPNPDKGGFVDNLEQCYGPEHVKEHQSWHQRIGTVKHKMSTMTESNRWRPSQFFGPGFGKVVAAMIEYAKILKSLDKTEIVSSFAHQLAPSELPPEVEALIHYYYSQHPPPTSVLRIYIARLSIATKGVIHSVVVDKDIRFEPETVAQGKLHEYVLYIIYNHIEQEQNRAATIPKYGDPRMTDLHLIFEIVHPEQGKDSFKLISGGSNDMFGAPGLTLMGRAVLYPDGTYVADENSMKEMKTFGSKAIPESISGSSSQSGPSKTHSDYAPVFGDFDFLNSGEYTMFYVFIGLIMMIITCCCLIWIMMTIYCVLRGVLSSGKKSNLCLSIW